MRTASFLSVVLTLSASAQAAPLAVAPIARDAPVDFAKDIHPLFKRSCLACHNTTKAKAGLNLESPQMIMKGGDSGPAAFPGKAEESLLLITAAHREDPVMPPPGNKVNATDFSPDELGLLKLWIDQGLKGGAVVENVSDWRPFPVEAAPVAATALSASGRVAAAARGNQVQLTEVATGVVLGFLTDPELAKLDLYKDKAAADRDAVLAVAFGGDDLVATGGFRTARLWRRGPLSAQSTLELPQPATCLAASGSWAAAGDATGMIRVWEIGSEKPQVAEWKDHASPVKALAFSPDGRWLISAAEDRSVRVWSVETKSVVHRAEAPAVVAAFCFLKNGTEVAAAFADGVLRVYAFPAEVPAEAPKPLREHKVGDQPPVSLQVPDAAGTRVVWAAAAASLHLIDTADGKRQDVALENPAQSEVATAERRQQTAQRLLDARKARLAAAVESVKKETENLKATHQAQEKARAERQRKLDAARIAAAAAQAAPDDGKRKEAAGKAGEELEKAERAFTDAKTNAELAVRMAGQAAQAQASAEGAATAAETALAEAVAHVETLKKAPAPLPPVKHATLLDGGKAVVVAFEDGRVQWHAVENGSFLDAGEIVGGAVALVAGPKRPDRPHASYLLAARPDRKLLHLPARRAFSMERQIGNPDDAGVLGSRVTALGFSSDARLLATGGGVPSRSGEVKLWRVADGSPVLTIPDPHSDTVNGLAFSPDDALIATAGSDRWARVFRTDDGRRTAAFEGHSGAVLGVAWRSDGLALATGGADRTLRFWDYLDVRQTRAFTSFAREVSALAWLGSGDTVASASGDAGVRMNEERLPGAQGFCLSLSADPSGRFVAAGGEDGILRIWDTAQRKLLREVR